MKKTILVTGASGDIGHAFINEIHLFEQSLNPEDKSRLITTSFRANQKKLHADHVNYRVDFSSKHDLQKFCEELTKERITHFVQLHGDVQLNENISNFDLESWNYLIDVNLTSTIIILNTILPEMVNSAFGRIVLMSTASANHGGGRESFAYGLAKHSVYYLVKHLAKYYGEANILVNSVSPGLIPTKFHSVRLKKSREDIMNRAKSIRVGRYGEAEDVARILRSLTLENSFISGEDIKIDGADFI